MVDTRCGRLHKNGQFLSRLTHLSLNVTLTHLHLEVGSVFLSLEPGWTFVTVSVSRMPWKHRCVTSEAQSLRLIGLLALSPSPYLSGGTRAFGTQPPCCGEAQATLEKPRMGIQLFSRTWAPQWRSASAVRHVSEEAFRFQLPVLGSISKGPTSQAADMSSPLYPGWILYPQKPWEKIHSYCGFKALSFGVNCYATIDYRYYSDMQMLQRESLHNKSYLYSLVVLNKKDFSKLIKTEGIVVTGSCEKGKNRVIAKWLWSLCMGFENSGVSCTTPLI